MKDAKAVDEDFGESRSHWEYIEADDVHSNNKNLNSREQRKALHHEHLH